MPLVTLTEIAVLLAAMTIAPALARWLGIGSVLGYLIAGIALGPHGFRHVFSSSDAHEILELSEFGIVFLLFLIGLELRPRRLWSMRSAIFKLGGAQVALTALVLALFAMWVGQAWSAAVFIGFALALSSTAFALQVLEEQGDLTARHGRLAFAVLLFQDLAAIPLIALVPLFATKAVEVGHAMDLTSALRGLGTIAAIVVVGYFGLDSFLRLVARTKVKEAMTAAALLTVVGVAILMLKAGLSPALGAFIAGALLSESAYRHQIEADIQPFQGILLGLFFTAVGMSLNVNLVITQPVTVIGLAIALVAVKTGILYTLGRLVGLDNGPARRLGLSLSQGGEFGFVLFSAGLAAGVLSRSMSDLLVAVVTVSMAATPLLLVLDRLGSRIRKRPAPAYDDDLPAKNEHVVIAGFGRFGQIVARVLRGKKIPFIALDISAEQVDLVKKFGSQAFFGDASRAEILEAAQVEKARAFVLAIDDVEASLRTAALVRNRYPDVPIIARARNRNHAHRLLDLGITSIQRETFLSALEATRLLLIDLGYSERESERITRTFRAHDEQRLIEDYADYSNMEQMQAKARSDASVLERLFAEDAAASAKDSKDAKPAKALKLTAAEKPAAPIPDPIPEQAP
ncbi:monovalent cation:proton antiporter-2 (CPA2) family protein [Hyphomicrobium sp. LHD-15]|uniref:monovalent cation:proton antiporter-2 (CPA2) family protein n=1 Tax=Hyphomicrobium sp. LHD-15 TaxID=3072142 RepID=UPI00280D1FE9|nr:monovalent cation:proton antiporter-2 (CPA2) family protein [Hyphomicrobium sp. LHD-15]MDQ8700376.1 monovalent cation:proton antiporter-2 (CPA2) family protein [Hyphomicrobium sp. LHD-15]